MAGAVAGGGALLSTSLQALLDRIASREVLTFLRRQKLGDKPLRKLRIKLLAVDAVLDDAEAKQFTKPAVRNWVDELKDAVYDAEDLLDDIAAEATRRKMESDSQSQVRNFKSRLGEITDAIEFLAQRKDVLGLKEDVGGGILSNRWPTTSLVDECSVCGRKDDLKKIVEYLFSHNANGNNIDVIALVGMGGIGKTTLAQLVYNDRRMTEFFDMKAWVCVSDEFDLLRITKTILKAMDFQASDDSDLNLLQLKLKERVGRKKFLIVLDDVWNEKYNNWDMLQTPLTAGLTGSKIVVTTRSDKVASVMRSIHVHHLEQLSFEDCWSLFAKHAFENGDSSPYPKLEEIGKEIVRRCKGLPLAAKTLGSALYSELRVTEWENALSSKIWDLPSDEVLPALMLSYSFLPSHLKRCFAYCSIFPKDYKFEKENLILLWMAEGFLPQTRAKKTMEEVGDAYFRELLSRSFFQKSNGSHRSCFVMHDLINDLAQLVSGKFCVHLNDGKMNETPKELRHFSYLRSEHDRFDRLEAQLNEASSIRTFLPLDMADSPSNELLNKVSERMVPSYFGHPRKFQSIDKVEDVLFLKFQYLRVLSLRCYEITDLSDSIGDLKHLRYLDLTNTPIKRLPESLCDLHNLQTLILCCCEFLIQLPKMMCKLIGLHHLDIRFSGVKEMPSEMGQLKSLQKLSNYIVGKQVGTKIGELRELPHIGGSLVIQALQNVVDAKDASEANLIGKQRLHELELEWGIEDDGVEKSGVDMVLDNLQPHSNLKRLTINGYSGSRFPKWLGGASVFNVVSLRLWRCKNVSTLPSLGKLPSLKHLYIWGLEGVQRVEAEFYGTDSSSSTQPSFPSLKTLSFQNMVGWKAWLCLGELPCLKELYVEDCPKLRGDLPNHLPFLRKLVIENCEQLVAGLPRIPAIRDLTTRSRDISQWKELPLLLQELSITNSDRLESLLEEGTLQCRCNTSLQILRIINCPISRPVRRVCLPTTLKSLRVEGCMKLDFLLPEFLKSHHPFLEYLRIFKGTCSSFLSFPLENFPRRHFFGLYHLNELQVLSINGDLRSHSYCDQFTIDGCPNLVSICCKNSQATPFQSLVLKDCPELIFPVQDLPAGLTSLSVWNCDKATSLVEWGLQKLSSLATLKISQLANLSSLDCLGLHLLTSLRKLEISDCPKLKSLTEERLPTSISFLGIHNCSLLKDRCKFWTGEDWPRIAHIQRITIDDQIL